MNAESKNLHKSLDPKYTPMMDRSIPDLSTPFATAYHISGISNAYILLFDNTFPVRIEILAMLLDSSNRNIIRLLDYGKIVLSATKTEKFATVFEMPIGQKLSDLLLEGSEPFREDFMTSKIIPQIANGLDVFAEDDLLHGNINPENIYYEQESGKIILGEYISSPCGYTQLPEYESLDRLLCHNAGKGDRNFSSDYFSFGMVVLFCLTARHPFGKIDKEKIAEIRLERGSCDATIVHALASTDTAISIRMENLLKGLMTDRTMDRWKSKEVYKWIKKREMAPPISNLHKRASTAFVFDDKEYYSRKYLAHDLFLKWTVAKRNLKIFEISRWISIALKRPEVAKNLDLVAAGNEVILQDEKLARVIAILDPYGPIRYPNFSCHISGIGSLLAYGHKESKNDILQQTGTIFHDGMVDYWIRLQPNSNEYNVVTLSWTPRKIREYIRKQSLGFGMERCMYELNKHLPCQSTLTAKSYSTTLPELIKHLDNIATAKNRESCKESDPMDRHIAGFIGSRVELEEELRIQSLRNFPYVGKNPQVLIAGLLTIAQSESRITITKGLTAWLEARLTLLVDGLHSKIIRKELSSKLRNAAQEGNINTLFKIISSPIYAKKDLYGFAEAKQQYRMLHFEIAKLQKQSNIRHMAYKMGLRIAVTISYLICTITILYVMLKAS